MLGQVKRTDRPPSNMVAHDPCEYVVYGWSVLFTWSCVFTSMCLFTSACVFALCVCSYLCVYACGMIKSAFRTSMIISTHCVDIREQLKLIEKGVSQKESRFINRALRKLLSIRKRLNDTVLRRLLMVTFISGESICMSVGVTVWFVGSQPSCLGVWRV